LTLSANVIVADGALGVAVVSAVAPVIHRAGDHATTIGIVAADKLTMKMVQDAVSDLRSNNVPDIDGSYNCFLTSRQLTGLYRDPEFQVLYRGAFASNTYESGKVAELLGARFIETTESPIQKVGSVSVYRAIVCGQGALVEGDFEGTGKGEVASMDEGLVTVEDGIAHVTREPLDRLKQIVAQSWYSIVGFAVPTDTTVNTSIIPTATNSALKRAVILESA
jgi:N4-gp56 family major capsid protein